MQLNQYTQQVQNTITQRSLLYPLDVLLVGATGVGKSSTLNALFGQDVAKVGYGVAPETQDIHTYSLDKFLRFHDSPGLGDGKEADISHAKKITQLLLQPVQNHQTNGFLDMVMVILDGGSRDFGTTYKLLEQVIINNIDPDRIMVCINQADMAMKGRNWDKQTEQPNQELFDFLEEKASSVQKRLHEATGIQIKRPCFYSAEYSFNLDALMQQLVETMPKQRRIIYDTI